MIGFVSVPLFFLALFLGWKYTDTSIPVLVGVFATIGCALLLIADIPFAGAVPFLVAVIFAGSIAWIAFVSSAQTEVEDAVAQTDDALDVSPEPQVGGDAILLQSFGIFAICSFLAISFSLGDEWAVIRIIPLILLSAVLGAVYLQTRVRLQQAQ